MADDGIELPITLTLNDGQVIKGLVNVEKAAVSSFKKIGETATGTFAGLQLNKIFDRLTAAATNLFTSAIAEAKEAELNIQRLNFALAATGRYTPEASKQFQDLASKIQATTTVSDDTALALEALAVTYSKTNAQAIKLTETSVDLAAVTGQDVETAMQQLAGTLSGQAGRLQKLFPELAKYTEAQLKAGAAVDFFNSRFAGAAASQVNTFDGRIKQASNAFNDLLETLGGFVTQSPAIVAVIKFIGEQFNKINEYLKGFGGKDVFKSTIQGLITFGQAIVTYVIGPIEFLYNVAKTVFYGIRSIIQDQINKIVTAASGVVNYFAPNSDLAKNLKLFSESSGEVLQEFDDKTKESFQSITKDFKITDSVNGLLTDLQRAVDESEPISAGIKNNLNKAVEGAKAQLSEIDKAYQQGIVNAIAGGVSAFTKSLATGTNAFEAFKNTILGIIGDMAIQIGTTLIGIGIGIDAIKTSLATLTGGVAIAAGLALVAIGGALKGLSGGGISAPSAGQATTAGGGYVPTESTLQDPSESVVKSDKGTVTVNIQGDVLDSRESGLRIVEMINDAFGGSGANLVSA